MTGAIFFDRDGTIIVDRHYPHDPAQVEVLPAAADALRRVNAAGVPVIVVTNQSGIGRGLISPAQYERVHERMITLLEEQGARVDATYFCPHWEQRDGECDCRKPGPGLFQQAAREHAIALEHSAYIGDRWRDIEAGVKWGGLGMLVPRPSTPSAEVERALRDAHLVESLGVAVTRGLAFVTALQPTRAVE